MADFACPSWAIPADLLASNAKIVYDDPETGEGSLSAALERVSSKWWRPRQKVSGIAFYSESCDFFQLRYLQGPENGQRYDAIANSGYKYYFGAVPEKYRAKIQETLGIAIPGSGSFWDWAESVPELPIFEDEGPAKALALIGIGYPAISGFGAFGGIERHERQTFKRPVGKRKSGRFGGFVTEKVPLKQVRLAPDLARFAIKGRSFVLVPDMDASPKTRRTVAGQFLCKARLLEKRGCKVRIAYWDAALGKGIDDVLAAHGEAVARQILDNPLTPTEFALKIELSFEIANPNATVNTRDLQIDAPELPKVGLVFSDSPVGTGKTKLAARETAGRTLLAPYPLRSLAKSAATGLNATYRNEGKLNRSQGAYFEGDLLSDRLTICYDSLPKVNLQNQFAGELEDLLLDEITHGMRHAATGATCRSERIEIFERLIEAIKRSKRVLAFDADLTRTELDIIRELRPGDTEYYLKNTRKPDPWQVTWLTLESKQPTINGAIEETAKLLDQFGTGMVHWACDGRATSEKIADYLGSEQCAVINSARIQDKDPQTLLAISGRFDGLEAQGVKYIITSPSVVQGLSWEEPGRFVAVAGTFGGCSITPRQMRQSLARVREAVPRIVWAAPFRRVPGKWGNESDPRIIKNRILEIGRFNAAALSTDFALTNTREIAVDIAARLIAADNLWAATPAASLKVLLEDHGHQIQPTYIGTNGAEFAAAAADWEEQRDRALIQSEILNAEEAKSLKFKSEFGNLTQSERLALERFELCRAYGVEPEALTLELIRQDRDGLRPKLRAFEQLFALDGLDLATAAMQRASSLADFDSDRSLVALRTRQALGLPNLIESFRGGELSGESPEMVAFAQRCETYKAGIKAALNYTVRPSVSPINLAGELLAQLGLQLKSRRQRMGKKIITTYTLSLPEWERVSGYAENRRRQGIGRNPAPDPPPSDKPIQRGVDQAEKPPESPPPEVATPILSQGRRVKWGTRIGDWLIASISGDVAKVRQATGYASRLVFDAPLAELREAA